ncbi:MAG: methylated-DNA--[protein]-cysteine S-methyltransferase [Betaproteobacteria bacterium]|nr:MAG: methylated-DNA--[protein]-cysteine S-methyltransferase [Betaproteobacteria bacterium]
MRPETPFQAIVRMPVMHVGVRTEAGRIAEIRYLETTVPEASPGNALAERAARQLERYAADPDFEFDLPLAAAGSAFQRRVWQAMCRIPRGRTRTYGELARALDSAPRAVGQACGANPFPLVIPCHRVVAASGIGGFAHHAGGFHVDIKRWLLRHEKAI